MWISNGFLTVGLMMALIGAILIYKSLRASPREITENGRDVRYIGSIPIMVNGSRKWILTAFLITAIILVYLTVRSMYPNILVWSLLSSFIPS